MLPRLHDGSVPVSSFPSPFISSGFESRWFQLVGKLVDSCWLGAHADLTGDEKADRLAKLASHNWPELSTVALGVLDPTRSMPIKASGWKPGFQVHLRSIKNTLDRWPSTGLASWFQVVLKARPH